MQLQNLLHDVEDIFLEDDKPKLYYGTILESHNAGKNSYNMRMTKLRCHPAVKDFYFKAVDNVAKERGIHDGTKDRIIIMYGTITISGIGLCIERVGWGEFDLLPAKYDDYLD